ncbi:hypothetical protein [Sphaerisporangium corydalis]|uniref:Uncharacterized protein n=1 Tax=Sphaerisporangium corydalis TaxID=1441875 RepID=A0ABV9EQN4_9ACTN|nr:hypothetical protein [Sphaerisporangium corydalis]
MDTTDDLSPGDALAEIGRVRRRVGRSASWTGWQYLVWGLAALCYWPAMLLGHRAVAAAAAIAWVVMTVASVVYSYRQGVYGREYVRDMHWVTNAWVVTMFGAAGFGLLMPKDPSGWWIPAALAVSVLAALPVLYAAWRLRPWERAR